MKGVVLELSWNTGDFQLVKRYQLASHDAVPALQDETWSEFGGVDKESRMWWKSLKMRSGYLM